MPDQSSSREALLGSLAYAVKRLPKGLLQRLQREHVTDEPARLAAGCILRQLELSYEVTGRGLEKRPPTPSPDPMGTGEGKLWEQPVGYEVQVRTNAGEWLAKPERYKLLKEAEGAAALVRAGGGEVRIVLIACNGARRVVE